MDVPFLAEIDALNASGVDFVTVGGVAVILHGHGRNTLDLDIIVRFDRRNVHALVSCLRGMGYHPKTPVDPELLADENARRDWKSRNMVALAFFNRDRPYVIIDVFIDHPIDYDELVKQAVTKKGEDGRSVRICSIQHLIQLKTDASRPKDLLDIEALQIILEESERR